MKRTDSSVNANSSADTPRASAARQPYAMAAAAVDLDVQPPSSIRLSQHEYCRLHRHGYTTGGSRRHRASYSVDVDGSDSAADVTARSTAGGAATHSGIANGFGDVGVGSEPTRNDGHGITRARGRPTRSSHQLEEVPEETAGAGSMTLLSPVESAYYVGYDRVRRSRRFIDGSYTPVNRLSSDHLRGRSPSSSNGSQVTIGPPIEFNPPTVDWQFGLDQVFGIPIQRAHRGIAGPPRSFAPNAPPRRCKTVAGDGNCLFRALSYWICGSEDFHLEVRQVIVDELVDNASRYEAITEDQGISAADYVRESRMATEGVWGSDVEIFVAATLLRTPIAVYSAFGDRQYLWQVFEPITPGETNEIGQAMSRDHDFMIFLQNSNNHFEPVVDM